MRGLTKRWRMRGGQDSGVKGSSSLLERVLAARGLGDPIDASVFLDPRLTQLHDPSLIPDLDRAAERIFHAARSGERIVIYGDYDVDGITATAILYHVLRAIAPDADVRSYVPHRLEEGYGLNTTAIESIAEELRASGERGLVVSVDCGVTAHEPARRARELGLDLIITDHHNPPGSALDLPPAFAVVHPRRHDSAYPFPDLSGAGVAYKLAWRLATLDAGGQRVRAELRTCLIEMLAPAALGAIADVVPLVGENRVLARFGLERLRHTPIEGLRALIEASGLAGEKVGTWDVGFRLAPRLNACGRLGHAREAVELLTVATGDRARVIAEELTRLNNDRRGVESRITEQADEQARRAGMTADDRRAIVLAHSDWHAGVIGIVCSRLVERYHRPTILLQRTGSVCHGSGRSIEGFNLHAALERASEYLDRFGGHDMAAGLALRADRLDAFAEAFTADATARLSVDQLTPEVVVDCEANLDELSIDSLRDLQRMEPCGRGNPEIRTLLRGVAVQGPPRALGATGAHLSFFARQGQSTVRVVAWNWAPRREELHAGARMDLVVGPKISTWGGRASVHVELVDAGPA
ncbi:MAG: single-stranded-DNA-specific exonuclease RecJ [Phycisphaerae bacterium]|nr:single-stranded-DNA-specific exonuclease RecJ [Phycisphaerae bacterium]